MRKRIVGAGLRPARDMEREGLRPSPTEPAKAETIFRGPDSANRRVEIALTHDDYKEGKGHGWLEVE